MVKNNHSNSFLIFEESEHFFVYNGGNGDLIEISEIYYDVLKYSSIYDINNTSDVDDLIFLFQKKYSQNQLKTVIDDLVNNFYFSSGSKIIYDLYNNKIQNLKSHNGLWLNISHDCNLNCKYCFGNGGDYGKHRILMSKETAKRCIDKWYSQVDLSIPILEINFFGGEPLMNQDALFYCVDYINNLFEKNIKQIRYNLTTNGTIINDRLLELFKENHFRISVSIDGIEKLHNLNRKYISGKGSFMDITRNIKKYKEFLSKISAQITLTKEGIPYLSEAVKQLWDLGVNMVRSNLVFGSAESYTYEQYSAYHAEIKKISMLTYDNLIQGKPYTYQNLVNKLRVIKNKDFNINCFFWGGGAMIFSPEGERFRCYRFMENDQYKLSNNDKALHDNKPHIEKCSNCWAQLLCADGCVYENGVYSENINEPAEEWCIKTKISLEEALRLYARIYVDNPEIFNKIS